MNAVTTTAQTGGITPYRQRHIAAIREAGKADRRALTDAIQVFAEYTDPAGNSPSRPDLAYVSMTRTIYAPFGLNVKQRDAKELALEARNTFDETELVFLQVAERSAAEIIWAGVDAGWLRVEIKQRVKENTKLFAAQLAGIRNMRAGRA